MGSRKKEVKKQRKKLKKLKKKVRKLRKKIEAQRQEAAGVARKMVAKAHAASRRRPRAASPKKKTGRKRPTRKLVRQKAATPSKKATPARKTAPARKRAVGKPPERRAPARTAESLLAGRQIPSPPAPPVVPVTRAIPSPAGATARSTTPLPAVLEDGNDRE